MFGVQSAESVLSVRGRQRSHAPFSPWWNRLRRVSPADSEIHRLLTSAATKTLRYSIFSIILLCSLVRPVPVAHAQDWPQFLGPTRNGKYAGTDLTTVFPKAGPPVVWKKTIGQGFSGPVVADGKLILFHRMGDKEIVECLDSATGKEIWRFDYPTHYRDDFGFDEGPRSTPSIASGRVYTFGAEGMLHCLDFATGKKLWAVDTHQQFDVRKGFFGAACSPLVEGRAVLLNIGGAKAFRAGGF